MSPLPCPRHLARAAALLAVVLSACSSGSSTPPACAYAYSDWGACTAGQPQTRTVVTATPAGCQGTPELSRTCPDYLLHVPSPAWEEQVIYFVMTDRFANGDPGNDDQGKGEFDPANPGKYSGGDLQGLLDKLDYIQGLGATAVWITPPVANMWWDPLVSYGGYHGYWARDLTRVDVHAGTLDAYQALSSALHKRGMYLVQDVVPNHMGNFFGYATTCGAGGQQSCWDQANPATGWIGNPAAVPSAKPTQPPFDQDDPTDPAQRAAAIYHWTPPISNYLDPLQEKTFQISDLDDLNTENPVVRAALKESYGAWIRKVGVDAFRVDTAKFVPHDFWNDFFHSSAAAAPGILAQAAATGRSDFLAFGEVYEAGDPFTDAADLKIASFLGTPAVPELPSVLAFPLYADLAAAFGAGTVPTTALTYRVGKMMDPALYPRPDRIPTFVDNHDVPRFLKGAKSEALAQALSFIFTAPGIPVVYYGTEQDFSESRAAMFKGGYQKTEAGLGQVNAADHFDTASAGYQRLKKLAALRRSSPAFTRGSMEVLYDDPAGPGPFVYRRRGGGETVLVLLNSADSRMLVSGLDTGLAAGTQLEVLHGEGGPPAPKVGPAGLMTIELPARAVLVARATATVVAPPPPAATITVSTPIDGQTFSDDVTISGTVSPATTRIRMVLDGFVDRVVSPTVAADGSWSILLPVSGFEVGLQRHTLAFYDVADQVATPTARFSSNVVFNPVVTSVDDPAGDDKGPGGTYRYPSDATFKHQNDLTNGTILAAATTMKLVFTMADLTTTWNPQNGFDHVAFTIFFEVPGQGGATVLPLLHASAPPGFTWRFAQTTYGWSNLMHTSSGASATDPGALGTSPTISVDAAARAITFTYNRNAYGLSSWSGVRIYATTWDIDGLSGGYRTLSPAGEQYNYGGGAATDPYIMDAWGPVAIP
jgi:glycosidase